MNRYFITLLGVLISALLFIAAIFNQGVVFEDKLSQVAVTSDACTFAQSVGIKTTDVRGICLIAGEFNTNILNDILNNGGTLQQNDYQIELISRQIIGIAKIPDRSTAKVHAQNQAIAFTTGSFVLLALFILSLFRLRTRNGQHDDENDKGE